MRFLKTVITLVASTDISEAFNQGRWGGGQGGWELGRPVPGQVPLQSQGPILSPNGGPDLEACTPYDAQPSICEYHLSIKMWSSSFIFQVFKAMGDIPPIQMAGMYLPSWYVEDFDTSKQYVGFVFAGIKGRDGRWRANDGHS